MLGWCVGSNTAKKEEKKSICVFVHVCIRKHREGKEEEKEKKVHQWGGAVSANVLACMGGRKKRLQLFLFASVACSSETSHCLDHAGVSASFLGFFPEIKI